MMKNIKAIYKAFLYSMDGLKCLAKERAIKQEVVMTIAIIALMFVFNFSYFFKLYITTSLFLVFLAEIANTAIETVVNRFGYDIHELSKKAKDIGSALVFVALVHLGIVLIAAIYSAI